MNGAPSTAAMRSSTVPGSKPSSERDPARKAKPTAGCASATRRITWSTCSSSVRSVFRNLRRAGVL